jgi:hypothetical protein
MSKGPGKIERSIRQLFDGSPDLAFVSVELVEHCYPGITEQNAERKHFISVLRAANKITAEDPDWAVFDGEGQGRGYVFFNQASVQSYALARIIAQSTYTWGIYRSRKRAARAVGYFPDPNTPGRYAFRQWVSVSAR